MRLFLNFSAIFSGIITFALLPAWSLSALSQALLQCMGAAQKILTCCNLSSTEGVIALPQMNATVQFYDTPKDPQTQAWAIPNWYKLSGCQGYPKKQQ